MSRLEHAKTPEERLAAVAFALVEKLRDSHKDTGVGPSYPDYADFRDAFRPHLRRELIKARMDEAGYAAGILTKLRIPHLSDDLKEVDALIAEDLS